MTDKADNKVSRILIGVACIAVPLLVGMISAVIAGDQMKTFGELNQPPLSPPAALFPLVWTILYILMGISLLLILRSKHKSVTPALILFIIQLTLNFFWSPVFFVRQEYLKALIILIAMLLATIILAVIARRINKSASLLLIPYIIWMSFAAYLNAGIGILNS